ncbi:VIT and vWA domain-containing protein [Aspergillus lucknowensis]|uniref:von Willebrand factor type A domain-containing protein n=1 Tax=Aspergillus lucknowensis TaxID=176173 RepID=A0ABR4LEJ7_9EURO
MTVIPGILFSAVEPPNPYEDDRDWERIRASQHSIRPRTTTGDARYIGHTVLPVKPPLPDSQPPPPEWQPRQILLPPFSVSLAVSVTDGTAKAVVTQTFRNDSSKNLEKGTYQFPVPYESSVVDFKCQIGTTKTLQGHVKPRPEARQEFNEAVQGGQSAGLVEQDSPEIFRTELGNIPPHTTVEMKLSFIFFLKYTLADDVTTTVLTIPTYVAPRYGNPGFELRMTHPLHKTKLSLDIDILTNTEIRDVRSDTHQVAVERGGHQRQCQRWADFVTSSPSHESTSASVKLDGDSACLDRDFVLVISSHPPIEEELPHATLEISPDSKGSSAMMVEIPPSFMLRGQQPIEDTEVIFLADRSGSMLDKIPGLKSSLEFFLRGLPRTRFNLYCFGSDFTSLWPASREYGDDTLGEALDYVSRFTNNMGGTDLLPALESLVACRGQGSLDVIVLTDGEVWQLQKTIEFVRKTHTESNGAVRFFAMGIGSAVSHQLVEGIANAGGGYAEIIPLASSSGWEARMVAVLKAAMTGHVTGVSIEVEGVDIFSRSDPVTPPTVQMSPGDVSSLSPFVRNRIFILAENSQLNAQSVIKIKRRSLDGREVVTAVPLYVLQEQDSTLHKFAARALLGDLERGRSWIQHDERADRTSTEESELTRKEGERLGCLYSQVSKWTSFVAVETLNEVGNEKASSDSREYATSMSSDLKMTGVEEMDVDWDLLYPGGGSSGLNYGDLNIGSSMPRSPKGRRSLSMKAAQLIGTVFMPGLGAGEGVKATACHVTKNSPGAVVGHPQEHVPSTSFARPAPRAALFRWRKRKSPNLAVSAASYPVSSPQGDELEFVRRVLRFQKSNGMFEVPESDGEKVLGVDLYRIVESLQQKRADYNLAVTVAVVAWLEVKLPQHRGLWLRMVEKAREYIQLYPGSDEESLLDAAEEMVKEKDSGEVQAN